MELSTLYWILILPDIGKLFGALGFVLFIAAIMTFLMTVIPPEIPKAKKYIAPTLSSAAFLIVISVLMPSEKQMMYIIGGYAATNVENIEKLPKNVVNAANKFLESYTDKEKK